MYHVFSIRLLNSFSLETRVTAIYFDLNLKQSSTIQNIYSNLELLKNRNENAYKLSAAYFYFFSSIRLSILCVGLLFMFDLAVICLLILHFYLHRRQQCMSVGICEYDIPSLFLPFFFYSICILRYAFFFLCVCVLFSVLLLFY